jgi:CYTH domain-containing protein
LIKTKVSFMYQNQHFIIDTFENIEGKPSLLRVETEIKSDLITKPEFLKYFREVTDEEEYSTYNMADIKYKIPEKDRAALCEEPKRIDKEN